MRHKFLLLGITLTCSMLAVGRASAAPGATITVNSTADTNASDGVLTLREAMLLATGGLTVDDLDAGEADNVAGSPGPSSPDTIVFDPTVFPSETPGTISLTSTLPTLSTHADTIDGSQLGVIVSGGARTFNCLVIQSDSNVIKGLQIRDCDEGITIADASWNVIGGPGGGGGNVISANGTGIRIYHSGHNRLVGNRIGTNPGGSAADGNGTGVSVGGFLLYTSWDNVIGGPEGGAGNVISGNSCGISLEYGGRHTVQGNLIGTDSTGMFSVPNGTGISGFQTADLLVGGGGQGERNIVSGNAENGVRLYAASGASIVGNFVGIDAAGVAALPNAKGLDVLLSSATIGGSQPGERNVISGNAATNPLMGVTIGGNGTNGNTVRGNYIGTDAAGTTALPNATGVVIYVGAQNNTVGGTTAGDRNVISGNGGGVAIYGSGANSNVVKGNYIGTDATGTAAVPNNDAGYGVLIMQGAQKNVIGGTAPGEGNIIAFNTQEGVLVDGSSATANTIRGNSMHSNGAKGIQNKAGGNTELAPPTITGFGSVMGTACPNCTVDIYSDDEDEGRVYEGSTTANGAGNWSFSGSLDGPNVTATATDSSGNTSEFSPPVAVPEPLDSDSDGFTDAVELYLGTDPLDACPDNDTDDAWPLDMNKDTFATMADVFKYAGRIGSTGGPPPSPNWLKRLDLDMNNFITMADVFKYSGKIGSKCT